MSENALTFTQEIAAPKEQIYHAFTNPAALQSWFADIVEADARENGRFYAWWNAGQFYASGLFQEVVENEKVVFSWQARWEPGPTRVQVTFEQQDGGTLLTLVHSGLGEGDAWKPVVENFEREWPRGLANLKSILETGVDKRIYDRPRLGVYISGVNDPQKAEDLGVPVTEGIILAGAASGTGADKAGLQANDVVYSMAGVVLDKFGKIGEVISPYKAGDQVDMVVYRGSEKKEVQIELNPLPIPDFPLPPKEMAEELRKVYAELDAELDAALVDVTEEKASLQPAEGEWCAKEVLAHMIISERFTQGNLEAAASGQKSQGYPFNAIIRIMADFYTLPELVVELKHSEAVTAALIGALPDEIYSRKWVYFGLNANYLSFTRTHTGGHINQIKAAIAAAGNDG